MEETMTGSGLTLGSPGYMSPEHARGGVEIDARADLYSLGCVLYEMLAGAPPFTGETPLAVLISRRRSCLLMIEQVSCWPRWGSGSTPERSWCGSSIRRAVRLASTRTMAG
jgi:serine/threonine protein kinase